MRKILSCLAVLIALSSCGENSVQSVDNSNAPKSDKEKRKEKHGKLTGEEGLTILGGTKKDDGSSGATLGVNSFLWRATLDTLSFMPLASADPFGGVIITDWYEDPQAPGERYKINALILDKSLRADGVKITVFKQKLAGATWRDQKVDDTMERSLEDTILTRARELRVAQLKS